jgi:hypothetical protein
MRETKIALMKQDSIMTIAICIGQLLTSIQATSYSNVSAKKRKTPRLAHAD